MILWTLHPRYLDSAGLLSLWKDALLARTVLTGQTTGYRHAPQLIRFRTASDPLAAINAYLVGIANEARVRGLDLDRRKIRGRRTHPPIAQTRDRLLGEWDELLRLLGQRSPELARLWQAIPQPGTHTLFQVVDQPIPPRVVSGPGR